MKRFFKYSFLCVLALLFCSFQFKDNVTGGTRLTWGTFNIRYDNPDDGLNNWKYRKDSVARFILDENFDVIGLQEVLHNQLDDLKERLPGYTAVGVGREDGKTKGEYAPVLFRTDKFELLDSNTLWLSQYPDSAGFIGWDGACTRIATWAKLKDIKSGKIFMAVNTHFDHVGVEARKNSALLIIEKIKEIVGSEPAVLTGDFNVNDESEAYNTITTNEFVLNDAYRICNTRKGPGYTFHDFGKIPADKRQKIDFIFVTPNIRVVETEILQNPETITGFLSDHNPHTAVIEF